MTIAVILVGRTSDFDDGATKHKVVTQRHYLAKPTCFANLPLSYALFNHLARFVKDGLRAAVILEA